MRARLLRVTAVFVGLSLTLALGCRVRPDSEFAGSWSRIGAEASPDAVSDCDPYAPGGQLPLFFVSNAGETDPRARFQVQSLGGTVFFTADSVVFSLPGGADAHAMDHSQRALPVLAKTVHSTIVESGAPSNVIRMTLVGAARNPEIRGEEPMEGTFNYFIGSDPTKWRSGVRAYASIVYEDLYPGIDLRYDGDGGVLKATYVVAPGADPREIELGFDGIDSLEVGDGGELVIRVPGGEIRHATPTIYQEVGGKRRRVAGGYTLEGQDLVGFRLAAHDPERPLIIDPAVSYATYLGGNYEDAAADVAVDELGNIYLTGNTWSAEFPAGNPGPGGERRRDAFVIKLAPDGQSYTYVTFVGGDKAEYGMGIGLGESGSVYVAGYTSSDDFPRADATQGTYGGGAVDAFLVALDASGSTLEFATYIGGSGADWGQDLAVCGTGDACVVGYTDSTDFPTDSPEQPGHGGGTNDVFLSKLDVAGASVVYATYLGGDGDDRAYGVTCDATENAYVVGQTGSSDFPTTEGTVQPSLSGAYYDGFVTKFNAAGSAHVYSTYLGGSSSFPWQAENVLNDAVVDGTGHLFVTGYTNATDFPTSDDAYDRYHNGDDDALALKLASDGSALIYSTYFGGANLDWGRAIALDSRGSAYIAGDTRSLDMPTQDAFQGANAGGSDAFVVQLDDAGTDVIYMSYLGGTGDDWAAGIAVDDDRNAYVAGGTGSTDFPTVHAYQSNHGDVGDYWDGFVAEIGAAPESISALITPAEGGQLLSGSRQTAFFFPPGAFSETARVTYTPREGTSATGSLADAGYGFSLAAVYSDTGSVAQLEPGAIYTTVLTYTTTGPAIEDTLGLYYFDGAEWVVEPTSQVDTAADTVTAAPDHFSDWAVLGETRRVFLPLVIRLR